MCRKSLVRTSRWAASRLTKIGSLAQEATGQWCSRASLTVGTSPSSACLSSSTTLPRRRPGYSGRAMTTETVWILLYMASSGVLTLIVIRYYAQQQRDAFLYIALELCQASLAEVVEKPHLHRDIAN